MSASDRNLNEVVDGWQSETSSDGLLKIPGFPKGKSLSVDDLLAVYMRKICLPVCTPVTTGVTY